MTMHYTSTQVLPLCSSRYPVESLTPFSLSFHSFKASKVASKITIVFIMLYVYLETVQATSMLVFHISLSHFMTSDDFVK